MLNKLTVLPAVFLIASASAQVYVDDSQTTTTPDGTSWATAYPNLQDAIFATSGPQEFRIAEGVYTPLATGAPADPTVSFELSEGDTWIGGWKGNETGDVPLGTPTRTILDGYSSVLGVFAYHVVTFPSASANTPTSISRVVITNGKSLIFPTAAPDEHSHGAGLLIGQDPAHQSLLGPAHVLSVVDCTFVNNESRYGGSAIWSFGASELSVIGCTFVGNKAISEFALTGSLVNHDGSAGTIGIGVLGDAATAGFTGSVPGKYGMAYIARCKFEDNVGYYNQGVWVGGCATTVGEGDGECWISNCLFDGNISNYTTDSCGTNVELANNPIAGASVSADAATPATVRITNCTMANTSSTSYAGAWSVYLSDLNPAYQNDTLHPDGSIYFNNSISVGNNEVFFAELSQSPDGDGLLEYNYSVIDGQNFGGPFAMLGVTVGVGNLPDDTDPLFINASAGIFYLQNTSPCLDAGNDGYIDVATGWGDYLDTDSDGITALEAWAKDFNGADRESNHSTAPNVGVNTASSTNAGIVDMGCQENRF